MTITMRLLIISGQNSQITKSSKKTQSKKTQIRIGVHLNIFITYTKVARWRNGLAISRSWVQILLGAKAA